MGTSGGILGGAAFLPLPADPGFQVGDIIVAEGVDNGNPSNGVSPDLWRISFESNGGIYPTDQPQCWLPFYPPVPIDHGNIVAQLS